MQRIMIIIALAGLQACKCPEKTTSATAGTTTVVTDAGSNDLNAIQDSSAGTTDRLVVSFISIGEGTFPKAKGLMDEYINQFEQKHNTDITYSTKPWGREGESDQIFDLKGLNAEQEAEFVNGMKQVFEGNQLIIIEENRKRKDVK